jgi:hypothetical protein
MTYNVKRHAVVQPLDPSYRIVPLTQEQNALVDTPRFDEFMEFNWCAHWSPDTQSFYAVRNAIIDGRRTTIKMHREVLGLKHGDPREGDHRRSGDTLDNRISNLRIVTSGQNQFNVRKRRNARIPYKGVSANGSGFLARIHNKGTVINLGTRHTPEEAALLYDAAAIQYFGEFAHLNFPLK